MGQFLKDEQVNADGPVRIAYICICHRDPKFIARMAKALDYEGDTVFIHVDNKVDKAPFKAACKGLNNVVFVENTVDNYWGGFNAIVAIMRTLQLAMEHGPYNRFVHLQGQDYPLVSNQEIHEFFEKNRGIEFCRANNISESTHKANIMKICGYYYLDYRIRNNPFEWVLSKALNQFNRLGIPYRKRRFQGKDIYHGWTHFALTRECTRYLVDVYNNNEAFNKYMSHRFPVDELYIHTVVHNSPFKNKLSEHIIYDRNDQKTLYNLTYFEAPNTVTVFTKKEDAVSLRNTKCLFVRKVNSASEELLDELDRMNSGE